MSQAANARVPARARFSLPVRLVHATTRTREYDRAGWDLRGWLELEARFEPAGVVDVLIELRTEDGSLFQRPVLAGRNHLTAIWRPGLSTEGVVLHIAGSGDLDRPLRLDLRPARPWTGTAALVRRGLRVLATDPRTLLARVRQYFAVSRRQNVLFYAGLSAAPPKDPYRHWIAWLDEDPDRDRARHEARLSGLARRPLISVLRVVPSGPVVAGTTGLREQIYPAVEEILAVPAGSEIGTAASRFGPAATRVVQFDPGEDRAGALNRALAVASGEYVVALPEWAKLPAHAFLEWALALSAAPQPRLLYADEDTLAETGERSDPRFKPAWSPEVLRSHDYLGDPTFFHARTLRSLGGWRTGFGAAADHDLKLRFSEAVQAYEIVHIAKVLLHRTGAAAESAGAAPDQAAVRVVASHLERVGLPAAAVPDPRSPYPRIRHRLPSPPLVSLLIPTRDRAALLSTCIRSILERTVYQRFEIVIIDNESSEEETFALFRSFTSDDRIRVLRKPGPFNFSSLNNEAAAAARGAVLGLLNNDLEVISPDWLDEMVGHAVQPEIGCVGAKLYYPDDTIQHAGVVIGLGSAAGHGHKGAPRAARGYLDRLVTVTNVSAVTGACLVVRKEVYDEVGGLDATHLEVAFNDIDFCLKVRQAGYRNVFTPFAELYHHESASRGPDETPEKARRFAAEVTTLRKRWGAELLADPYYSPHLTLHGEDYSCRTR